MLAVQTRPASAEGAAAPMAPKVPAVSATATVREPRAFLIRIRFLSDGGWRAQLREGRPPAGRPLPRPGCGNPRTGPGGRTEGASRPVPPGRAQWYGPPLRCGPRNAERARTGPGSLLPGRGAGPSAVPLLAGVAADDGLAALDGGPVQRRDHRLGGGGGHVHQGEPVGDLDRADVAPVQARLAGDRADQVLRADPGGAPGPDEQPGPAGGRRPGAAPAPLLAAAARPAGPLAALVGTAPPAGVPGVPRRAQLRLGDLLLVGGAV